MRAPFPIQMMQHHHQPLPRSQQQLQDQQDQQPSRPLTDEERVLIPHRAVAALAASLDATAAAAAAGGPGAAAAAASPPPPATALSPEAEAALAELVTKFVLDSLAGAAAAARGRRGESLTADDVAAHLATAWRMRLPGSTGEQFGGVGNGIGGGDDATGVVKPYRRAQPSEAHRSRVAAAQRAAAAADTAARKVRAAAAAAASRH